MLMGHLNVCMEDPIGERAERIADMADEANLVNLAWYFLPRRWMPKQ